MMLFIDPTEAEYLATLAACRAMFLPLQPGQSYRERDLVAVEAHLRQSVLNRIDKQTIWRGMACRWQTPFD